MFETDHDVLFSLVANCHHHLPIFVFLLRLRSSWLSSRRHRGAYTRASKLCIRMPSSAPRCSHWCVHGCICMDTLVYESACTLRRRPRCRRSQQASLATAPSSSVAAPYSTRRIRCVASCIAASPISACALAPGERARAFPVPRPRITADVRAGPLRTGAR